MTDTNSDEIVCPTTKWFFKRMGLMFLMVAAFSGWFLYDGLVGYPKKIAIYQEYTEFTERRDAYKALEGSGELAQWPEVARENGWVEEPPGSWAAYAAQQSPPWPEKPKKLLPGKEKEQKVFAGIMAGVALLILGYFLWQRPKVLKADGDSFTSPSGKRVPFDAIFRVDKRKWKHKGLAYAHYKTESGGSARAVIDDLKFGGADKVLERVLGSFEGELIDRIDTDEDAEDESLTGPEGEGSEAAAGAEGSSEKS